MIRCCEWICWFLCGRSRKASQIKKDIRKINSVMLELSCRLETLEQTRKCQEIVVNMYTRQLVIIERYSADKGYEQSMSGLTEQKRRICDAYKKAKSELDEIVSKQISTKKEYDTSQQEVANLADLLQHLQAEPTTGAQ
ncbi:uncharacterized protein LOC111263922 [Varroa jacobsoni]|uniref:Uncharacterized protein n=1 Tax=Varroa destructor TaxID=109461 RepID=A0A7M7KTL9_VARDE|nr:uncharacterized protein LOC111253837 [Varroa destructor]XP_022669674.1 uncharacterized protein LOC111253837 [Varroa destructor]XP_022695176.1 uncharacterized protein LOC111263922 [Varroa jacobsoni]XP_022695177.1 uncharacterized protein LOC111263922 [Varroa jacobsoni]XP_022695178.1 uncharacterized protein LOC111263922 [Varroa jacobsoni]XP_022695179.1 uncharacterized protein LOC111263922 [Varroa jacobsoni]